jgi:hypothetical protein
MIIRFSIKQKLEKYTVLCTIGRELDRKEYLVFLETVKAAPPKDPVDHLHQELLKNFPRSTAKNILTELRMLQLVDERNRITDTGLKALEEKTFYEPEQGTYCFLVIESNILESPILKINDEKIKGEDADIPKRILDEVGWVIETQDKFNIYLIEIGKIGQKALKNNEEASLELNYSDDQWKVRVGISGRYENMDLSDDFLKLKVQNQIMNRFDLVVGDEQAIRVKVADLQTEEIRKFKGRKSTQIEFNLNSQVIKSTAHIENITLHPNNNEEANKWAEKLFIMDYVKFYRTENELLYDWRMMLDENPILKAYSIAEVDAKSLSKKLLEQNKEEEYWFVQAPIDFQLEGEVS